MKQLEYKKQHENKCNAHPSLMKIDGKSSPRVLYTSKPTDTSLLATEMFRKLDV